MVTEFEKRQIEENAKRITDELKLTHLKLNFITGSGFEEFKNKDKDPDKERARKVIMAHADHESLLALAAHAKKPVALVVTNDKGEQIAVFSGYKNLNDGGDVTITDALTNYGNPRKTASVIDPAMQISFKDGAIDPVSGQKLVQLAKTGATTDNGQESGARIHLVPGRNDDAYASFSSHKSGAKTSTLASPADEIKALNEEQKKSLAVRINEFKAALQTPEKSDELANSFRKLRGEVSALVTMPNTLVLMDKLYSNVATATLLGKQSDALTAATKQLDTLIAQGDITRFLSPPPQNAPATPLAPPVIATSTPAPRVVANAPKPAGVASVVPPVPAAEGQTVDVQDVLDLAQAASKVATERAQAHSKRDKAALAEDEADLTDKLKKLGLSFKGKLSNEEINSIRDKAGDDALNAYAPGVTKAGQRPSIPKSAIAEIASSANAVRGTGAEITLDSSFDAANSVSAGISANTLRNGALPGPKNSMTSSP